MGLTLDMLLTWFATYNQWIWPMQIVIYLLCVLAVFLALGKTKYRDRAVAAILAISWFWVGAVFFLGSAQTYAPSYGFAVAAVVLAALFALSVFRPAVTYGGRGTVVSAIGIVFVLYALAGYPIIEYGLGRGYPFLAFAGTFLCPTTVLTFGLLLLTEGKVPSYLLVIPVLFALSGLVWASLGVVEDTGMLVAGLVGTALLVHRERSAAAVTLRPPVTGPAH